MTDNLFRAIIAEDLQTVKLIIEMGNCHINSQNDYYGMTALHKAVELNNAEIVKLLLEHGAAIFCVCLARGITPLDYLDVNCARDSDPQTLKIVKMIVDQDTPLEMSSYHKALRYGSKKVVRTVLQSNIDLFCRDKIIGQTPIHYLAGNKNDGAIDELYGKKFDVNAPDNCGVRPLSIAARAGLPNSVEFLLDNGAGRSVEHVQSTLTAIFSTASHISLDNMANYHHVIELLLKYGADPEPQHSIHLDRHDSVQTVLLLLEPIIAYLALIEKQVEAIYMFEDCITDRYPTTIEFFRICRHQLATLDTIKIVDSLSLYELLISSDSKIEQYSRDPDTVAKIRLICVNEESYRPYGFKIRRRFEKAIEKAKLSTKAAFAFCHLIRMDYNASCLFVDRIMGYLSRIDLQRLCKL